MSNSLWPHVLQHTRLPCPSRFPKLAQIHVHLVGNAIQQSHPLSPSSTLTFNLFQYHSLLQGVSSSHPVAKLLNFQLQHQSYHEYPGLISFKINWLDLFAGQGTLKSLLQHHSSKASILWCSTFLTVQLSHWYMTTGKTIALTGWTFVSKVMSLVLVCCLGWS